MSYIKEYKTTEAEIRYSNARLVYKKVTPVFEDGDEPEGFMTKHSCFLYDDYSSMLKPGDTFYEIVLVEVNKNERRKGIGTKIVKEFFEKCEPTSVVLRAGVTTEELYEKLHKENKLTEYIYNNIVPFYEKLGFTDVNHTIFYFEECTPMIWPKSAADEAKRINDEFKNRNA